MKDKKKRQEGFTLLGCLGVVLVLMVIVCFGISGLGKILSDREYTVTVPSEDGQTMVKVKRVKEREGLNIFEKFGIGVLGLVVFLVSVIVLAHSTVDPNKGGRGNPSDFM